MDIIYKDKICKTFGFTEKAFVEHNRETTKHIKSYFNNTMTDDFYHLFTYLNDLNSELPEYYEFGADKCSIRNFQEFCQELDIDCNENIQKIIDRYYCNTTNVTDRAFDILNFFGRNLSTVDGLLLIYDKLSQLHYSFSRSKDQLNRYHFYNRERTLMFTCSSPHFLSGSFGYFGVTGSPNAVMTAFEIFTKNADYSELCWGGRDYV